MMTEQEAVALLAEVHDKCQNLLASAALDLPEKVHVEGMKGGIEEISHMTKESWEAVAYE